MRTTNDKIQGNLRLTVNGWYFFPTDDVSKQVLPLYHGDREMAEKINALMYQEKLSAIIIDEFSHPELFRGIMWGMGTYCYKLVDTDLLNL